MKGTIKGPNAAVTRLGFVAVDLMTNFKNQPPRPNGSSKPTAAIAWLKNDRRILAMPPTVGTVAPVPGTVTTVAVRPAMALMPAEAPAEADAYS